MVAENTPYKIYIVISQTGTLLSRILKLITGAPYNHVSLGMTEDLECMYSFGRKNAYNPFWAGFVLESPNFGTFKRFENTKIKVISLEIDEEKYKAIKYQLKFMLDNKSEFHYNYLGLWLAWFKIAIKAKNRFYCSEFIKYILVKYGIDETKESIEIPKPIDFLDIPGSEIIYTGKLKDYSV